MRFFLTFLFVSCSTAGIAQVSLDDLDAAADAASASMDEFETRLNDPDPDRARAVLHLLISQGDADQRRLAIRHGLQSTDRAIQATTLRAVFDSEPNLRAVFDPVSDEPSDYFFRVINSAGGVINASGNGSVTYKITGYDTAEECWTHTHWNTCLLRMRGDEVSMWFGDSWGAFRLNSSGQLAGEQAISQNLTNATIDLSE